MVKRKPSAGPAPIVDSSEPETESTAAILDGIVDRFGPALEALAAAPVGPRCLCDGRSFVVTRSRAKKGGGFERYCDGCGVVQGEAADSRAHSAEGAAR